MDTHRILSQRPHVCSECNYEPDACYVALRQEYAELEAERDKYKHRWECADSPLMRDVMAERDKLKAELVSAVRIFQMLLRESDASQQDAFDMAHKFLRRNEPRVCIACKGNYTSGMACPCGACAAIANFDKP